MGYTDSDCNIIFEIVGTEKKGSIVVQTLKSP
jgi:hypothetical protein